MQLYRYSNVHSLNVAVQQLMMIDGAVVIADADVQLHEHVIVCRGMTFVVDYSACVILRDV